MIYSKKRYSRSLLDNVEWLGLFAKASGSFFCRPPGDGDGDCTIFLTMLSTFENSERFVNLFTNTNKMFDLLAEKHCRTTKHIRTASGRKHMQLFPVPRAAAAWILPFASSSIGNTHGAPALSSCSSKHGLCPRGC